MEASATKSDEGEHPIPAVWTDGATVFAGTWVAVSVVAGGIWIGSSHFPTWYGIALLLFAFIGAGWWWGRVSAYPWAERIVKAATCQISYPSAEFGDYFVRLIQLTPSTPGSSISASTVITAFAPAASLASGGGAGIIAHLNFAVPPEEAIVVASVVAAIAFGLFYLSFVGATHDYQLEFRRESIQLYAAHQTAAQRPLQAQSAGTKVPMPVSPAMTFRILDAMGLVKVFGGALWCRRLP